MTRRMRWAISLSLLLTFLSCVQSDVVLSQPEAETGHPGCSLRLTCKTSGFDLGIYWMGWIRQIPGQGLDWLLWYDSSSNNNYAPRFQNRLTAFKDLSNNIFSLAITRLKAEDTAIYYCVRYTAMGGFDHWGHGTMVTVTSGTPSPPILYSLVSSCQQHNTDGSVTYGCLAMDYSPEITSLVWKKNGQPITTGVKKYPSVRTKKGTYTLTSQLTITESEGECSKISCEVRHSGSDKSIGMECPPPAHTPNVLLTVPSNEEITSRKFATMVCSIVDFNPISMTVKWLKNGQLMTSGFVTPPACEVNGNFSASSRLTVSAGEWFSKAVYTCQVTHQEVTQSQSITASAPSLCTDASVTILPPPIEQVLLEATVTLTCVISNAPYGVNVSWSEAKKPLKSEIADQPGADTESVVSKLNISTQAWLSGALFDCVASHQDLPTPLRNSIRNKIAEEWASGASYSCVAGHEAIPLKIISRMVNKSSDSTDRIWTESYEDDNGNIWTTASTFIVLFFLSISYSAAVTLVKIE
ncbi:hypothetical protein scyTo_0019762 [Scyliorhinus torazame]|uniref:Ig-like domain-containing protein n=1 Tax=Scyliorhinus torazame TaxID=75743 RepID=A0A401PQM3_SCYTO|nr:hypothetical protein [Scyliorhinus torazame]